MKKLFLLQVILMAGLSCKKAEIVTVTVDYLSFGTAFGFCTGDCARFFKMEGEKIYPDTSTRYSGAGSIGFNPIPLTNDKYLLAKELKDNFPSYLFDRGNQTFGCPDCADQGGVHLEVIKNGTTKFWHIDTNVYYQPAEIRPYIERVLAILSQL